MAVLAGFALVLAAMGFRGVMARRGVNTHAGNRRSYGSGRDAERGLSGWSSAGYDARFDRIVTAGLAARVGNRTRDD